jgi:hypothetical protein
MIKSLDIRRHPDGSIDFDFYRRRATWRRRLALKAFALTAAGFATILAGADHAHAGKRQAAPALGYARLVPHSERSAQTMKIPGTDYEIDFAKGQSAGAPPSRELIKAIKRWLSINFGLPTNYPDPIIELVPTDQVIALRYKGFPTDEPRDIVAIDPQPAVPLDDMKSSLDREDAIAAYEDEMKTIYLPKSWTGNTPAELSVLVHEIVHHLQGATKTRYGCPQAREELAYAAQDKWLGLFGRNLRDEFKIDPRTLAVSTRCIY